MGPEGTEKAQANDTSALDHLQPSDEDLLYEEELLRNPYSLKMWWRYLEARRDAPARRRYILYERALKALPVSYKVNAPSKFYVGMTCSLACYLDLPLVCQRKLLYAQFQTRTS